MKKLLALLAASLLAHGATHAATLTLSNQNAASNGAHGIADLSGTLLGSSGVVGVMGRMTISDSAITTAYSAGAMTTINAAFEPFDPVSGTFTLNSLGDAGAFETAESFDTRASTNAFGGSAIYVWIYKGASRATASEHLIVKLSATFPTDSESEPPAGPQHIYLRPDSVASVLAGELSATTHDYGRGSGPLATYRLAATVQNRAPVAIPGTATGDEDASSITGTLTGADADNNTLTFAKATDPAHGTVTVTPATGAFSYVPAANYHGTDSFTFVANDGLVDSTPATITITINSVPDAPVAQNSSHGAISGLPLATQLLASDGDGDTLTFTKTSDPTKGTVSVMNSGFFIYTPTHGQVGADSFTFTVSDGTTTSNTATVSLTIAVNGQPTATPAVFSTARGDLLIEQLAGEDAEDQPLTFAIATQPSTGTLTLTAATGAFRYQPTSSFTGTTSFTFTVTDGFTTSAPATVSILVGTAVPEWTWMLGSDLPKQFGSYPSGMDPSSIPGARTEPAGASDGAGLLYLFGGNGYPVPTTGGVPEAPPPTNSPGLLSDLWRLNTATGQWSLLYGYFGTGRRGTYGGQGSPSLDNRPGARQGAALAVTNTVVWVFGGTGLDSTPTGNGLLNDLWRYQAGQWTWMAGSDTIKANGDYGSKGFGTLTTTPGARTGSALWVDAAGNLWLFGGRGLGSSGSTAGNLNDLWVYPASGRGWTWVRGSNTTEANGSYGSKGITSPGNDPGSRANATFWTGKDGNLYLFGGQGKGATGAAGYLSDLWCYDISGGQWTWLSGSSATNGKGVFGVLGTASAGVEPPARAGASGWVNGQGKLFLGMGQGSAGHLEDVWCYDLESSLWTWIKGSAVANLKAFHGIQGLNSPANTPGGRRSSLATLSLTGDLWLFGGYNGSNNFNDGWRLDLPASPSIRIVSVGSITATGATVSLLPQPNNQAATGTLYYWPTNDPDDVTSIDLGSVTNNATTQALSGLAQGTSYSVSAKITTSEGESWSAIQEFATSGIPPVVNPKVAFETSASAIDENLSSAFVRIVRQAPTDSGFTLTLAFSGTASAGASGDYLAPPTSVIFIPGQLFADVAVPLVNNNTQEPNETVILTLTNIATTGAPAYPTVLGTTLVHTLTINDDDNAPTIVTEPASQLVAVGAPLTLSIAATGAQPMTYVWKRGTTTVGGATKATLSIAKAALTNAGTYTVAVTNVAGSDTSEEAVVGVVDTSSKFLSLASGASQVLSVATAGSGLSFEWQKDGTPIGGATSATHTLTGLTVAGSGIYRCRVFHPEAGEIFGGFHIINVSSTAVALPPQLAGAYAGVVERHPALALNLGGSLNFNLSNTGAITATLLHGTTKLTGKSQLTAIGPVVGNPGLTNHSYGTAIIAFPRAGLPSVTAGLNVYWNTAAPATNTIFFEGSLSEGSPLATAAITGYRNPFSATNKATTYVLSGKRDYTFGLHIPAEDVGDQDKPQGTGIGAFAVSDTGTLTVAGQTADGVAYTAASIIGLGGEVPTFVALASTSTPGSLVGTLQVLVNSPAASQNAVTGELSWLRLPAPAKSTALTYRAGFGPMVLAALGGHYPGIAPGSVLRGLPNTDNNATLSFARGGLGLGEIAPFTFSIRNLTPTGVTQRINLPTANPNKVSFKPLTRPVGSFSGTFSVPHPTPALTRTATFTGIVVKHGNTYSAPGFFLLPQLPEPGQTLRTSPVLSGSASLD